MNPRIVTTIVKAGKSYFVLSNGEKVKTEEYGRYLDEQKLADKFRIGK